MADVGVTPAGEKGIYPNPYELTPAGERNLERIRDLQPEAVATIRRHGFVFDKMGPLADDATELDRWKMLAFSLYTDLVEASTIAENLLEDEAGAAPLDGPPAYQRQVLTDWIHEARHKPDGSPRHVACPEIAEAILARLASIPSPREPEPTAVRSCGCPVGPQGVWEPHSEQPRPDPDSDAEVGE